MGGGRSSTVKKVSDRRSSTVQIASEGRSSTVQKVSDGRSSTVQKVSDWRSSAVQKVSDGRLVDRLHCTSHVLSLSPQSSKLTTESTTQDTNSVAHMMILRDVQGKKKCSWTSRYAPLLEPMTLWPQSNFYSDQSWELSPAKANIFSTNTTRTKQRNSFSANTIIMCVYESSVLSQYIYQV